MDMVDVLALTGLERLFIKIEDRYGRAAAWLVTSAVTAAVIAIAFWLVMRLVS